MSAPRLSVVIISWNTRELLLACLESLYAAPLAGGCEVIVVDNGSQDGSPEAVAAAFPQVCLIQPEKNLGFAGGNNRGLAAAHGEHLLLLNPDTLIRGQALACLLAYLDDHPEVGAVGPRLLNPDLSLQESCYPTPTLGREFWRMLALDRLQARGVYPMASWPTDQARPVEVLMGAALLLRRTVLDQVGGLDEQFFIYSEEVDLCRRVRAAGWTLAWVPQAEVIHYGGQSTRQLAAAMFLQLYANKVRYFRKHDGPAAARAYKGILALAALGRLALTPLTFFEPPATRARHRTLAGHYRRLLIALPGF